MYCAQCLVPREKYYYVFFLFLPFKHLVVVYDSIHWLLVNFPEQTSFQEIRVKNINRGTAERSES